jgi:hypothetical protein
MTWTDGSMYHGNWIKGIQHGNGKMCFPNGVVKEGVFENNVFKHEIPRPPEAIGKNSPQLHQ